ncbi:MAG: LPS assembly lipoprotein LptE [Pseudomonadota bacterium]
MEKNLLWPHGLIGAFLIVAFAMGGCGGFKLRGGYALPASVSPVAVVAADPYHELTRQVREALRAAGAEVTLDPAGVATHLSLQHYRGGRSVTAVDAAGKAVEYEIWRQVEFGLKDVASGEWLISPRTIRRQRLYAEIGAGFGSALEQEEIVTQLGEEMASTILRALEVGLRPHAS